MLDLSSKLIAICLLLSSLAAPSFSQYPICDGKEANEDLELKIDGHIDRLMKLRRPGWGWANTPGAVLSLQLSKQQSFFGKESTIETMREELLKEVNNTNIGKLALYAMAIQSLCENPRRFAKVNVIKRIRQSFRNQWNYDGKRNQKVPKDRWYKYGLAVQALCLNNVKISRYHLYRIVRHQNDDGSYGSISSVDDTAQVVLAWSCLRKQTPIQMRTILKRRAERAINNAISFLQSQVNRDGNLVWIGNKYSTPGALLALNGIEGHNKSSSWSCLEVMRSIVAGSIQNEPEGAITQRLPVMRGNSVLSLQNDGECQTQTASIPQGYEPNYDPNGNLNCSTFEPGQFTHQFLINVKLSVLKTIGSLWSGPYDQSVLVEEVNDGNTLLQIMAQARCQHEFQFETVSSSFGPYVTSVDGLLSNAGLRQYWSLVNAKTGDPLPVGIGQYRPRNDQHILFQLKTY